MGNLHIDSDVATAVAVSAPAVADALEDGSWRLALVRVTPPEGKPVAFTLLDTRAGILALSPETDGLALAATTTAEVWRRLAGTIALPVEEKL